MTKLMKPFNFFSKSILCSIFVLTIIYSDLSVARATPSHVQENSNTVSKNIVISLFQNGETKGTAVGFLVPDYPASNSFVDADAGQCCVANGCNIGAQDFPIGTESTLTDGTDGVCKCDMESDAQRVAACMLREIADYLSM